VQKFAATPIGHGCAGYQAHGYQCCH
jgi:hypothetical protein